MSQTSQTLQPANPGKNRHDLGRKTSSQAVIARIARELLAGHEREISVRLWDGSLAFGDGSACCTLLVNEPGVVRELVLHPDLFRLVESYLDGRLDLEGDFEALLDLGERLGLDALPASRRFELARLAMSLPNSRSRIPVPRRFPGKWSRNNSRETISHHYDVGNDFYRLWLDPEMVYSCAYFASDDQPLAEAQRDKLDYLCRKLRLQPGQKLLDIGCGWGGLALWAARHYGAEVHGITLSEEQCRLARERVKEAGLEDRITIELLDYRDLSGEALYDRIVSVGMFEHVGIKNFPTYFGTVRRLLKPEGIFVNHGITSEQDWRRTPATRFINHYIFPDGELARISTVLAAMEDAGFEPMDVENLRPHYALTLRHWVRNLEARRDEAIAVSSEKTYRLWRLYMAACALNFDKGGIAVHQVVAGIRGNRRPLPLRREDLYARPVQDSSQMLMGSAK